MPRPLLAAGSELELEAEDEVRVLLRRVEVPAARLGMDDDLAVLRRIAVDVARPALEIAAVEEWRESLAHLGLGDRGRGDVARDLPDEDVAEPERVAVGLQLDLARRVDRLVPLPVVLEDRVVDDPLVVEIDGDAIADHETRNAFHSPTGRSALLQGLARPLLVVEETARADRVRFGVPDLHLRRAAEVEAAVSALLDLPVGEKLEVGVVARRAEALALPVEGESAVLDLPVGPHPLVGRGLGLGQLLRGHLRAGGRVGDEAFPAVEGAAVEERDEAALAQALEDDLAGPLRERRDRGETASTRRSTE